MRSRKALAIGSAVTVVVAIGGWWAMREGQELPRATNASPSPQPAVDRNAGSATVAPASPRTAAQRPGGAYESLDPRWSELETNRARDPAWEWKRPIAFYGRVVDDAGQPVAGAIVQFEWSDLSAAGASASTATSDDNGEFSLAGVTGRGLTVRVAKEGYYTPRSQRSSFEYAQFWAADYHEADPNRPILFRLQRKGAGENLVQGTLRQILPPDGSPVRIDLLAGGRASAKGQLELSAVTNNEEYPPPVFDWKASIAVADGGLVEHNLEFPFEAPEEGYVSRVDFDMSSQSQNWRAVIEKNFFLRFGTPAKHGRIRLRLSGSSSHVTLTYWVNPTGSRNLEPATSGTAPAH